MADQQRWQEIPEARTKICERRDFYHPTTSLGKPQGTTTGPRSQARWSSSAAARSVTATEE